MNDISGEIDRIAPTRKPEGAPVGYQSWRDLAFVHWRVPVDDVRSLLPAALSVDTFDGSAWVGLVPFAMRNVRPWWSPSVPGISHFLETNVRTYVHHRGRDPGVWFFSLEASQSLAVRVARKFWKLSYFYARMNLSKDAQQIHYQSKRRWPEPLPANTNLSIRFDRPPDQWAFQSAEPGTFDHFLVERYYLYTTDSLKNPPAGRLYRGQVHHEPYHFCRAELVECRDELVNQAGFNNLSSPEHVAYSPGVDVDIYPLKRVD